MSEKKEPGLGTVAGLFVGGIVAGAALVGVAMEKFSEKKRADSEGKSGK